MAEIADLVENMNLEEAPNGEPGTEPKGPTDQKPNGGSDNPTGGSEQPNSEPGGKGEPEGGSGADPKGDTGSDKPADPNSGYVADEVEEEATETPKTEDVAPVPSGLSPELQYVVDRLPNLTVNGKDGPYTVKAAGQLPADFEFASKREELVFNQALAAQEYRAQQLAVEYKNTEQQKSYQKANDQENELIRHDIGDLQREGDLPRFQYKSTDPKFNDDPAVKAVQEIMDYMNEKNEAYVKASRPYRITFRDAYEQMAKQIAKEFNNDNADQKREDNERTQVVRRTGASRSTTSAPVKTARIAPSMGTLLDRIENMDFA